MLLFPDATVAKMAGSGNVVHIIRGEEIIGNFPTKAVRYYGTELPPSFKKDFENQQAWDNLPPEKRAEIKAKTQALR